MNQRAQSLIDWAVRVLIVALCTGAIVHEVRLVSIEGSRFTEHDAHELELRMLDAPDWLRSDIAEIKDTLKSLDNRLRKIEIK